VQPGARDPDAPALGAPDLGAFEPLPATYASPAFCSRPQDDAVRALFCAGPPLTVSSLADLHSLLLASADPTSGFVTGTQPALLGHSTSLAGRLVSPLNPRIINVPTDGGKVVMAFQRGVQQVEIATRARDDSSLTFYLLTFRQACNDADGGCGPGDLYTPAIESDWSHVFIEDDEDLKNTPSDCRQCHQRGSDTPTLLMRELLFPWTHFFAPEGDTRSPLYRVGINGGILTTEYRAAKGDETYGNVDSEALKSAFGDTLQNLVDPAQALIFDAFGIMNEHFPPGDDWPGTPARSVTWDREYEAFKKGEHLALPYFDAHATDANKQASLTAAYRSYRDGTLAAADLPDLADIFPDDPQTRAEIGLETEPDATPADALVQACGTCHNDVLDQGISRARFNVDVTRLDRSELDRALDRLTRATDTAGAMPPRDARQLTAPVRSRLVDYLRQGQFTDDDRSFLGHAASAGMAGGTEIQAEPASPGGNDPSQAP
jgi:hypothetical protein